MEQPSFDQYRDEWLESVRQGDPSTTDLGNRFSHKLLTQWLDIDPATDEVVYCDGSGDGGIDLAYLYESDSGEETASGVDTWYLIQSKYGKAFQGDSTLLKEGRKVIDTLDNPHKRLSSLTQDLLERLGNFRRRASERDRIVLVFATERALTDDQRKTLSDVRAMGRERIGDIFEVETISIETIYHRALEDQYSASKRIQVSMIANPAAPAKSSDELLVCSVSLTALHSFLKEYQDKTGDIDQLYEKNVRRFLGDRVKVNKAIRKTLTDAPEHFGFYNNGITVVVADFSIGEGGALQLTTPYIVNGCQTTRTIWNVFRQKLKTGGRGADPELQHWKKRAEAGIVITKIVKVGLKGDDLLQNITRYTNSQNAVKEKDFLALVRDFQNWKDEMEERYDVFLEIQRGAWDSQRAYQKQHPDEKQYSHYANAFDLLKVYGAGWLNEAGTAFGRNSAFLPSGAVFKRIIGSEMDVPVDAEDLFAAYQLQQASADFNFGRAAVANQRRLTRFLFFNVAVELLKRVMIWASMDASHKSVTKAINKLFAANKQGLLLDEAIDAIDEYLTPGTDNSIFQEPGFQAENSNLNGYLKTDQVGNGEVYKRLIGDYARQLGRNKVREQIRTAIK